VSQKSKWIQAKKKKRKERRKEKWRNLPENNTQGWDIRSKSKYMDYRLRRPQGHLLRVPERKS
jgi:hypothetical protein